MTMRTDKLQDQNDDENTGFDIESMVNRVRDGEHGMRDRLIEHAIPFIRNRVSRILGKRQVDDTDELSIAILAFNESIDAYKAYEPGNFLGFASTVIQRRIIDHQRRMSRQSKAIPFSNMELDDGRPFEESRYVATTSDPAGDMEFREEITRVESRLNRYGLRLEDMHKMTPRHTDSRTMCVSIAQGILDDPGLLTSLYARYQLPVGEITNRTGLHRKTIEKHRRFIIFLVLLLDSELDMVKSYIETYYGSIQKGGAPS